MGRAHQVSRHQTRLIISAEMPMHWTLLFRPCAALRKAVAFAALAICASSPALGEVYPTRSIRIIVPYSGGSGADITARQTMAKLAEFLGQNIIVENRPGTSAIVGTDVVAKAAPDGYTLLFGVTQHAINPTLQPKLPYDTLNDFLPVARVTSQPLYMGVNARVPGNSVTDAIAHIKANTGKYNYASTGIGTSIHLAGAYFVSHAGLAMSHVPYTNASQCIVDLGRGEVQVLFYTYSPLLPQFQSGHIKILASTGAKRSAWASDIPTMEEAGMPGFVMPAWHGVFAPANTPSDVVGVLEKALAKVANDPSYRELIESTGTDIYYASSQEFDVFLRAEIQRFAAILKDADAKPQ
jgi:tripartite-type tricarboxylate transporter receptor subunit TctC